MPAGEGQTYDRLPRPLRPHLDARRTDHRVRSARPVRVVPGRVLRPGTSRSVAPKQSPRRWWIANGSWHLSIERNPTYHEGRAGGFHRDCVHARPQRPLRRGGTVDGVDNEVSFRHRGLLRLLVWAKRAEFLNINGESGYLEMQPAFNYDGVHLLGEVNRQQIDELGTGKPPFQFTIEAEHFADCIRNHKDPESPGDE